MTSPALFCGENARYFKSMSGETGIPYQNLINMYLLDCVKAGRKLSVAWKK